MSRVDSQQTMEKTALHLSSISTENAASAVSLKQPKCDNLRRQFRPFSQSFSSLDLAGLVQLFPELQQSTNKEEREKLYRKYHYLQMLQGNYAFPVEFARCYTIGDLLGDGTFGFVTLAQEKKLGGGEVAVKFISKSSLPAQCIIGETGLPKEIWLLRKCNHPGILRFISHFEDENYHYLVTEVHGTEWNPMKNQKIAHLTGIIGAEQPIDKQSQVQMNYFNAPPSSTFLSFLPKDYNLKRLKNLTDIMQRKCCIVKRAPMDLFECIETHKFMPKSSIKSIIGQLIDILSYLERNGIVHGDVKDENILIDHEYRIKLADFGSAFLDEEGGRNEKFFGTLQFAPPEVLNGKGYFGTASDVWSVGALLFVMVTGTNYLETVDEHERKYRIVPLESNPLVSNDFELFDLLSGLLQEQHSKRFTLNEAKAHSWFCETE
jgi:serine/threonine protein kinase